MRFKLALSTCSFHLERAHFITSISHTGGNLLGCDGVMKLALNHGTTGLAKTYKTPRSIGQLWPLTPVSVIYIYILI